jgi:hypothetical protein
VWVLVALKARGPNAWVFWNSGTKILRLRLLVFDEDKGHRRLVDNRG